LASSLSCSPGEGVPAYLVQNGRRRVVNPVRCHRWQRLPPMCTRTSCPSRASSTLLLASSYPRHMCYAQTSFTACCSRRVCRS
ncbi:unnamed protein product, partial [Ectocarpus sp. 13 AM-2016]